MIRLLKDTSEAMIADIFLTVSGTAYMILLQASTWASEVPNWLTIVIGLSIVALNFARAFAAVKGRKKKDEKKDV